MTAEKVQDCIEKDLYPFVPERHGAEREFLFDGMYMNIIPIISLFSFK